MARLEVGAMDIAKWEVSLEASQDLRLRGQGGEALFALVLSVIGRLDEDLARDLHDGRALKPLSVGPIDADVQPTAGMIAIPKGTPCWFSFSTLAEALTERVFQGMDALRDAKDYKLAGSPIIMTSISPSREEYPPPGTSYQSILEKATSLRTIALRFVSPTSFRREKEQVFLPLPELVFNSLLARWNAFAPAALPEAASEAIRNVKLARFRSLSSSIVDFSSYRIIGFTGEVVFAVPRNAPEESAKILDSLAQFAYYSGVGYKTTMGMGMVERLQGARRSQ